MDASGKKTKGEKTQEHITDCFIHLMAYKRWDRITVKEICAEAKLTRGTFYQYFDDIYDLMERIQEQLLDDLRRRYKAVKPPSQFRVERDEDGRIRRFSDEAPGIFCAWFEFCRAHKEVILALCDEEHGDSYFRRKLQNVVTVQLDIMMDWDGMPRDGLRRPFLDMVFSMHYYAMYAWLTSDDGLDTEEMANMLNTLRLGATYNLRKNSGRKVEMT